MVLFPYPDTNVVMRTESGLADVLGYTRHLIGVHNEDVDTVVGASGRSLTVRSSILETTLNETFDTE